MFNVYNWKWRCEYVWDYILTNLSVKSKVTPFLSWNLTIYKVIPEDDIRKPVNFLMLAAVSYEGYIYQNPVSLRNDLFFEHLENIVTTSIPAVLQYLGLFFKVVNLLPIFAMHLKKIIGWKITKLEKSKGIFKKCLKRMSLYLQPK